MVLLDVSLLALYVVASLGLFLYGMNCYVMIALFYRSRDRERRENTEFRRSFVDSGTELPKVTTQLPIYNERFVAERLLRAVVRMEYPRARHQIQVLDDSDDDTVEIVARAVERYRAEGYDVMHVRRTDRSGFKAGALRHGTRLATGEFLAVFDADFVPPRDFLLQTVPFFYQHPKIAMVQTRWGHVNWDHSWITRAQSVGIDGHFVVEQGARTWNGLYMNFNGTAGVWRRTAVEDAGGWEADTLTEDLDLSYRAQLAGWRMKYLADVVTPAEIPVDMNGLKSQQHRWAKGSIQTARKILPRVFRAPVPLFKKVEAVFHLTHYAIHPLMLVSSLLALPALAGPQFAASRPILALVGLCLLASTLSPSILYVVSQREAYADWKSRLLILPVLVAVGVGIAVNNSRAVFEALTGKKSAFVRTPKHGVTSAGEPNAGGTSAGETNAGVTRAGVTSAGEIAGATACAASRRLDFNQTGSVASGAAASSSIATRYRIYRIRPQPFVAVEILLAAYGFVSLYVYCQAGKWAVVPFLFLTSVGYLSVGILSLRHGHRSQPRLRASELASAQ
ncbi:MAG: glycosyltransferase [Candidatus Eisenbacteria bacterium]|nr:glycosyltransferase [Candidatus Eisenbacteria bacterium]